MKKVLIIVAIVLGILFVGALFPGDSENNDSKDDLTPSKKQEAQVNTEKEKQSETKKQEKEESKENVQTQQSEQKREESTQNQTTQNKSEEKNNTPSNQSQQTNSSNGGASVVVPEQEDTTGNLVWVPINGGTKYHNKSTCSNMKDPKQITKEHAEQNGYTACKRCY